MKKINIILSLLLVAGLTLGGCSQKANSENYDAMIANVEAGNWSDAMKDYNFNKEEMTSFEDAQAIYYYAQANNQYSMLINSDSKQNKLDAFSNDLDLIAEDYSGKFAEEIKEFKEKLATELKDVEAMPATE